MSKTISTLSDDLASAIESAGPGVVRVEATRRLGACGLATGFVWSPDGVIVTAHHVVERDDNIKVGLADDPASSVSATLVGRDPTSDIAVLRTDARDLTPLSWADQRVPANDISIAGYAEFPDNIRVGHIVFALGRPSKNVQANLGIVGAFGFAGRYLVTDVVMDPGFSGGPLVDANGELLGLNTTARQRYGFNVALGKPTLSPIVDALLSEGRIRRGQIGVGTQPARLPDGLAKELGQESGLLLVSVEPGSPADKSGLLLGDIIVGLQGVPVGSHYTPDTGHKLDDLLSHQGAPTARWLWAMTYLNHSQLLSDATTGKELSVEIVRGGTVRALRVVIDEQS